MAERIEDYAFISDCQTGALVARDGSIDWLCCPRFDSPACFAALLGTRDNGHWLLAPDGQIVGTRRRYRGESLVLETEFETPTGKVAVVDFMPPRTMTPHVVRIVEGMRGQTPMQMELVIRFDYGSIVPWVRHDDGGILAVAGPDALRLESEVETHGQNMRTVSEFVVDAGQRVAFTLTGFQSHASPPKRHDPYQSLDDTLEWWRRWTSHCKYRGEWRDSVVRSLITLKGLTYHPTGGIVAAPTTSLPEEIGGERNWDYRYCWVRDATFTLYALMTAGYQDEASAWRDWLLRAVAGSPDQIQVLYGLAGERRLLEYEADWLPGYESSRPVRIGNAAHGQLQIDVFGELMDAMHFARRLGLHPNENSWRVQRKLLEHLETVWQLPDKSIWEVRGPNQHFTYSKIMTWVAFDRAVKAVERYGLEGDAPPWRALREKVHAEVCARGFNERRGAFVQAYDSEHLDSSLLIIPLVGFLPPSDPRVQGTIDAIQKHLTVDGFVLRYDTDATHDGMQGSEGTFLLCSFWLADNLALAGRKAEAREIFERLLDLGNDVGLLSEEYDHRAGRLIGNFPQAFSHVALVNTAHNLSLPDGPSADRGHS